MIDEYSYGPAMAALTERRRRFVRAMYSNPFGSHTDWAKAAGYSEAGIRVRAHECHHDAKVQAAVVEYGKTLFGTEGTVLAVSGMLAIARNVNHPSHAKILEVIANRVGFGEKQQIEVTHRDLTGDALMARIAMLAEKHGVNVGNLTGNVSREAKLIEGGALEIEHDKQERTPEAPSAVEGSGSIGDGDR